jgi:hypothetical protein
MVKGVGRRLSGCPFGSVHSDHPAPLVLCRRRCPHGLLDDLAGKVGCLAQGFIPQMGIAHGHFRVPVCHELLQDVHVHLAAACQPGGKTVAKAMQGAEIGRQPGGFFDPVDRLGDADPLWRS